MAINAVHICVLTALALVPRNDFTFAVYFSALKNNSTCLSELPAWEKLQKLRVHTAYWSHG
jgi:hypothetical protein